MANVYVRGRTGWSVRILEPSTAWRSENVIYARRSRVPTEVVDCAVRFAEAIRLGDEPWYTDLPAVRERVKQWMLRH